MHVDERQLSEFLLDGGVISRSTLMDARARASERNESLYHALLNGAFVDSDHLRRAAAHTLGIPFIILNPHDVAVEALLHIPEPLSRTHNIIAFKSDGRTIEVALLDLDALETLQSLPKMQEYTIAPRFTNQGSIKTALIKYQKHLKEKFGSFAQHGMHAVDALIKHAILSRAGGIHIEPSTTGFLIRYRIGELLHEAMQLPEHVGKLLVEQLKSAAKLFPVASPQEGHFKVEHDNETHIVHVSTMPIHKGEKLIMRVTKEGRGEKNSSLETLGFHGAGLEKILGALHARIGLILVGGADGPGKSSLLYALLNTMNYPQLALASVEEEVTEHLPYVSQVSTKVSKLSYASLLRATLKHDPDVVMVSKVPDSEIESLILSAAKRKLIIAGITEITSSLLVPATKIVVQKGDVRRLCPHCRTTHRLTRPEARELEEVVDFAKVFNALKEEGVVERTAAWKDVDFYWPEGCSKCEKGYKGTVSIVEVLPIVGGEAEGGETLNLAEDALFKAARGETSIEEVLGFVKRPN